MAQSDEEGELLTPEQLAKRLKVDRAKIYGWIEAGELEAVNLASSGAQLPRWNISERAVRKFLDQRSTQ